MIAVVAGMKVAGFCNIRVELFAEFGGYVVQCTQGLADDRTVQHMFRSYEAWIVFAYERVRAITR